MTAVVVVLVALVGIFLLTRLSWVISRRERRSINDYGETLDVLAKLSNQSPRAPAKSRRGTSPPTDVREPEAVDREVRGFGADGPEQPHPRSLIGPLQLGNARRLRPLGRPSPAGLSGESPYGLGAPGASAFGSGEPEADVAGADIAAAAASRAGRRLPEAGEVPPGAATPDDAEPDTLRPEPRPERRWDRPAMVFVDDSVLDPWPDSTETAAGAPPSVAEADPSGLRPASQTDATRPDRDPLPSRWSAADRGSGETVIRLGLGEEEPETLAEAEAASAREAAGDALSQAGDGPIVFIDDAVASTASSADSSPAGRDPGSADLATRGLGALGAAAVGTERAGVQPRRGPVDGRRASTRRTRRGGGAHRRRPEAASLAPLALLEGLRARARNRKRVAAATAAPTGGQRAGAEGKRRVAAATAATAAATAGGLRSGAASGKRVAAATAARVEEGLRSGAGGGKRVATATAAKLEGLRSGAGDRTRVAAATAATAGGLRSGAASGKRVAAATAARVEDLSSRVPGGKRAAAAAVGAGVAAVVLALVLVLTLGGGGASHASGHRPLAASSAPRTAPPTTVGTVALVGADATDATYAVHLPSYTLAMTSSPGPCWVEVRTGSASGPVVLNSVIQAGQTETVPASGPMWVRVGFEANISITVNGAFLPGAHPTSTPYNFTFETS